VLVQPLGNEVTGSYPENLTIEVTYSKTTGGAITFASVSCRVDSRAPLAIPVVGSSYLIRLNSTDYGIGLHRLVINASTSGYKERSLSINWTIDACLTNYILDINGSYSLNEFYYGELMGVSLYFNDTVHSKPIENAVVNLTVQGENPITLTGLNGNYSHVFNSLTHPSGLWNITFIIRKANYVNWSGEIDLYAKRITTLIWNISPPTRISPGDELIIAVKLNNSQGPVAGQNITFVRTRNSITERFNETTNEFGIAEYRFFITSDIKTLTIAVEFGGNVTDFSSALSVTSISIYGGFFQEYWWIFILIGAVVAIGAYSVRARQKGKRATELKKKEILTSFQDVTKIMHLVVIHKGTGADIFDYKIQERLDPTLLAGFIQAVKDFGKELDRGES
jgi:hypothetical protein